MRILIIGANGQLGSEFRALSSTKEDWTFLLTDVEELDATDYTKLDEYCEQNQPNFIINCAAYTAVDIAETDADMAKLINEKVPKYLGRVAKKYDVKVIHVSTDYVFDGTSCKPYEENDLVGPSSVYGRTKLNGEIALVKENSKSIIIRTSWLYSVYGKNFVKTMLKLGEEREELSVIVDQVGTPTHAGDLAKAILAIMEQANENWKSGIYHYANEGVCSWYDFAKQIHEIGGIECKVQAISTLNYPTPAKRPAYSVMSKEKIKRVFNIEVPYWRDSLKECIKQLRNNQNTN